MLRRTGLGPLRNGSHRQFLLPNSSPLFPPSFLMRLGRRCLHGEPARCFPPLFKRAREMSSNEFVFLLTWDVERVFTKEWLQRLFLFLVIMQSRSICQLVEELETERKEVLQLLNDISKVNYTHTLHSDVILTDDHDLNSDTFTELDDDEEVVRNLFDSMCREYDSTTLSSDQLQSLIVKCNQSAETELARVLNDLLLHRQQSSIDEHVNFNVFFKTFLDLPRVRGERIRWVASLGLESKLARLLKIGHIFDGLKGLRELEESALQGHIRQVCTHFSIILERTLLRGISTLKAAGQGGSEVRELINSKFQLDGAHVGSFATLADFHHGPEGLIGTPNPRVDEGMEKEHCTRPNALSRFHTPNYALETWPSLEWEFVMHPRGGVAYPHTPADPTRWPANCGWKGPCGRVAITLDKLLVQPEVKAAVSRAALVRCEVGGLRLYTGPMYLAYNAALRGFPPADVVWLQGNRYETTIFVITSAVTKLSKGCALIKRSYSAPLWNSCYILGEKVTGIPASRRLFRGLGGMVLPDPFWRSFDECQLSIVIRQAASSVCRIKAATAGHAASTETSGNTAELPKKWCNALFGRIQTCRRKVLGSDHEMETRELLLLGLHDEQEAQVASSTSASAKVSKQFGVEPTRETRSGEIDGLVDPKAAGCPQSWARARVVAGPEIECNETIDREMVARMVIALPVSAPQLTTGRRGQLCSAVAVCCEVSKAQVSLEDLAEKPADFRGGVEFGLMSTTTAKETAVQYSGVDRRRGTLFEIQVGRIDVGASIGFVSQYPGEDEFLFPPLSCLEVMGEPRIDRTNRGEVVVLPLRVNLNLKAATVEDLVRRRKDLHAAMGKQLREELQKSAENQLERMEAIFTLRRQGLPEPLSGKVDINSETGALNFPGSRSSAGAPALAVASGCFFYELEILSAPEGSPWSGEPESYLWAGVATTGLQLAETQIVKGGRGWFAGSDEKSWSVFGRDGHAVHRGESRSFGIPNWLHSGIGIAIAVDLSRGRLLLCPFASSLGVDSAGAASKVDDSAMSEKDWIVAFESGVEPGTSVGPAMFPVVTAGEGMSIRLNFGGDSARPLRCRPPTPDFLSMFQAAVAIAGQQEEVLHGRKILEELGVSVAAVVGVLDCVLKPQLASDAASFNDDQIYQTRLNQVLDAKVGTERKMEALINLVLEGAGEIWLRACRNVPPSDYLHGRVCVGSSLHHEFPNYTWRSILLGWFAGLSEVTLPLDCPPCELAIVWMAMMECKNFKMVAILDADHRPTLSDLFPVLHLRNLGLTSAKFSKAVLGLLEACVSMSEQTSRKKKNAAMFITSADFRGHDFSAEMSARLVEAAGACSTLEVINGRRLLDLGGPSFYSRLRRSIVAGSSRALLELDGLPFPVERLQSFLVPNRRQEIVPSSVEWACVLARAEGCGWATLDASSCNLVNESVSVVTVSLGFLDGLTTLSLRDNRVSAESGLELLRVVSKMSTLQNLDLGGCVHLGDSRGLNAMGETLAHLPELVSLSLACTDLQSDGVGFLANQLAEMSRLNLLNLRENQLGPDGASSVANALSRLVSLKFLFIGQCGLGEVGWRTVTMAGLRLPARLVNLDGHGASPTSAGEAFIDLDLTNCEPGMALAAVALLLRRREQNNGELTADGGGGKLLRLRIGENNLGPAGGTALAEDLKALTALQCLCIESNHLGCEGIAAVSEALQNLSHLSVLLVGNNALGVEGADALMKNLQPLTQLRHLFLGADLKTWWLDAKDRVSREGLEVMVGQSCGSDVEEDDEAGLL